MSMSLVHVREGDLQLDMGWLVQPPVTAACTLSGAARLAGFVAMRFQIDVSVES